MLFMLFQLLGDAYVCMIEILKDNSQILCCFRHVFIIFTGSAVKKRTSNTLRVHLSI